MPFLFLQELFWKRQSWRAAFFLKSFSQKEYDKNRKFRGDLIGSAALAKFDKQLKIERKTKRSLFRRLRQEFVVQLRCQRIC